METKTESVGVEQQAAVEEAPKLVDRVRSGWEGAQKGLQQLEAEAQQALASLNARAEASSNKLRSQVKQLLDRLELRPEVALGVAAKKVTEMQKAARQQMEALPSRLVEGAGIASMQQVRALQAEVAELARKLDAAPSLSRKAPKSEGRAA